SPAKCAAHRRARTPLHRLPARCHPAANAPVRARHARAARPQRAVVPASASARAATPAQPAAWRPSPTARRYRSSPCISALEAVANAAHGHDPLWIRRIDLNLLAQPAAVDIDRFALAAVVIAPHTLQQ